MRKVYGLALACLALLALAAAASEQVVHQKGRAFSAATLTVRRGEPVIFLNDDTVPHNVTSQSADNAFDLGSQMPGNATPVTFDKAGRVDVICAIHPRMHMTIIVTE